MNWITWFDLKRYKIASMHISNSKTPLYGVPTRSVTVHLLHSLNDYPPMEITFRLEKVCGRTVVKSVTNNLTGEHVKDRFNIPVSLARDLDNDNLQVIGGILAILSRKE